MKKISYLLIVFVAVFAMNMGVNAASPIKSVDFCGIVKMEDVTNSVRIKKSSNTCKVSVELNDSSYTIVSGTGDITFTDGENTHKIVLKDASGVESTYPITVNFNSNYTGENPNTGDSSMVIYAVGIASLALIAVSYNRIKKYSKNVA